MTWTVIVAPGPSRSIPATTPGWIVPARAGWYSQASNTARAIPRAAVQRWQYRTIIEESIGRTSRKRGRGCLVLPRIGAEAGAWARLCSARFALRAAYLARSDAFPLADHRRVRINDIRFTWRWIHLSMVNSAELYPDRCSRTRRTACPACFSDSWRHMSGRQVCLASRPDGAGIQAGWCPASRLDGADRIRIEF